MCIYDNLLICVEIVGKIVCNQQAIYKSRKNKFPFFSFLSKLPFYVLPGFEYIIYLYRIKHTDRPISKQKRITHVARFIKRVRF